LPQADSANWKFAGKITGTERIALGVGAVINAIHTTALLDVKRDQEGRMGINDLDRNSAWCHVKNYFPVFSNTGLSYMLDLQSLAEGNLRLCPT